MRVLRVELPIRLDLRQMLIVLSFLTVVLSSHPETIKADESDVDLNPNVEGSHKAFLDTLNSAEQQRYLELLKIYDDYLASNPSDYITSIERCRFIEGARGDNSNYELEIDEEDASENCLQLIVSAFPTVPSVILYRLEKLWGDEAIKSASEQLKNQTGTWKKTESAKLYESLARQHSIQGNPHKAAKFASKAYALDSTIDFSQIFSASFRMQNKKAEAIDALTSRLKVPQPSHELIAKARALVELEAYQDALKAIQLVETSDSVQIDPVLYGRILEGVGNTKLARAKYTENEHKYNQEEVLTRLFYIDIANSDGKAAAESYRALRELGWQTDPFFRHRLSLFLHHPLSSWRPGDFTGLFGLMGMVFFCMFLPLFLIVPIHYVGLIRHAKKGNVVEASFKGLWNVWKTGLLLIGSDLLACYFFLYDELVSWFDDFPKETVHSSDELANYYLCLVVLSSLGTLLLTRKFDYRALFRCDWSRGQTIRKIVLAMFVLFIMAIINNYFLVLSGLKETTILNTSTGSTFGILDVLKAIRQQYGATTLIVTLVFVIPIYEEIVFRGIVFDELCKKIPYKWANGVQAVVFAAMHSEYLLFPYYVVVGVILARLRTQSGGLRASMLLHALNNLLFCLGIITFR